MAIWQSTIHGTMPGQTVDVVMGWQTDSFPVAEDLDDFANLIADSWAGDVMPNCCAIYEISEVTVIGIDDPTRAVTVPQATAGTRAVAALPSFVVANVHVVTGLRGRSYNGRFGIPGIGEDQTESGNGNLIDSTSLDAFQGAVNDFRDHVTGFHIDSVMAVISRVHNKVLRPEPVATGVTSLVVKPALGTRNSRKG